MILVFKKIIYEERCRVESGLGFDKRSIAMMKGKESNPAESSGIPCIGLNI